MVQSHSNRTLIMDNGGHSIKFGWSTDEDARVIPNCIVKGKHERKRVFVGEEMEECIDRSALFFLLPCERGYLVNWDVQQQIWERTLRDEKHEGSRLVLSHPNYLVPAVRDESCELLFEMFNFGAVFKSSTAGFVGQTRRSSRCCLVVDSGYSFTHIVPFLDGRIIQNAVIRLDVGGKLLTNQLKEWISYRELNVAEETLVMSECKEDACFVSMDVDKDMATARLRDDRNTIIRQYVLPDFSTRMRGELRIPIKNVDEDVQKTTMNVERFMLPEILFNPSDIGINQMGIADCIVESVNRCPSNIRSSLLSNIFLIGGNTNFPNFKERLLRDVQSLVDSNVEVVLREEFGGDPIKRGWKAAKKLVEQGSIERRFVTKAQYEEEGEELCKKAFNHFLKAAPPSKPSLSSP